MAMETVYARVVDRLVLSGGLSETSRLSEWEKGLAKHYGIDDELQFTIHLCLEEVVSNIIRHGYTPDTVKPITIGLTRPREGQLVFTVEDFGPAFNPLREPAMPLLDNGGELAIGGRGIRLLRAFAHTLEHQSTAVGNRLCIGFTVTRRQAMQL